MTAAAWMPVLVLLLPAADSDARIPRLIKALGDESQAFVEVSSRLLTEETLLHAALGSDGKWVRHRVVSQYSFAAPREQSKTIREIRQVLTVDGKPVKKERGLEAVASAVVGGSDKEKLKLLEQWDRYGIKTVATDFGQLLLLFTRESILNYEFQFKGRHLIGMEPVLEFSYSQIDGKGPMTVFKDGAVQRPKLKGEVWVDEKTFHVVKVVLKSFVPAAQGQVALQELSVRYAWWPAGCVMPSAASHRETLNGALRVENQYQYGPYRSFASAAGANK